MTDVRVLRERELVGDLLSGRRCWSDLVTVRLDGSAREQEPPLDPVLRALYRIGFVLWDMLGVVEDELLVRTCVAGRLGATRERLVRTIEELRCEASMRSER